MNFDYLPEQEAVAKAVSATLDEPMRSALRHLETVDLPSRKETLDRLGERLAGAEGYLHLGWGAGDASHLMHWLAGAETLAAVSASAFLAVETTARLFGGAVADHASEDLRDQILPAIDAGRLLGAVALADAEDGEVTRIELTGDTARIEGAKAHVACAPWATWFLLLARDADERPALVFLPRDHEGLRVGDPLQTLGVRGLPVAPLWLHGVTVPASHVAGPFAHETPVTDLRRRYDLLLAVTAVGLARQSFEQAKAHAGSHTRGKKPIIAYQAVRHSLAEMLTLLQTAELAVRRATWMCSAPENPEAAEADTLVQVAKVFAAEAAEQVSRQAMQVLAAQGYLVPNRVERAFRDAPLAGLAGTPSTVCRLEITQTLLAQHEI